MGQHSSAQLLQNLSTALPHVVNHVRENWDNVQSIHIKTSSSASLPIWSCRLDEEEGGRWDGLTRVPIPDDADEGERKKKRTLEFDEEPEKKKKKSDTARAQEPTSTSQVSRPNPPPTGSTPSKSSRLMVSVTSTGLSKGVKKGPSTSTPMEEPTEVEQRSARPAAVDFFDSDKAKDRPSPSKPFAFETRTPPKSAKLRPLPPSEDSVPMDPRLKGERSSETKTILKPSKKVAERATPAKEKRVKFAAKLSDSKTKRDRALGTAGKKLRSGGGKSSSVKDGVLGKRAAVK